MAAKGQKVLVKGRKRTAWHVVSDGKGVPTTDEVVVAVWVRGATTWAALAYRDAEDGYWYSAEPDSKESPVNEPDYWMEAPF